MLFNSFAFFLFFPTVTTLYFVLPHRARWGLLLAASCAFYMFFIPKYILILAFTILVDYVAGILIERATGRRRVVLLAASIVANVGVLALFKYFNFVNANIAVLARLIGWNYPVQHLALILPIGLSFHTFQAMAYTIEVYRGRQEAEHHIGIYALYVMFYPQLVAGPIERPQHLLPQLRDVHRFDYGRVTSGLKLMAWGLFKKVVVADRLAILVNAVYAEPTRYYGPVLTLATALFAFQIFCDFSGYTDIARGAARVMGFRLMRNFDSPYQAQTVSDFWRRWHISLSSWFGDYVFKPISSLVSRRLVQESACGVRSEYLIYAVSIGVTFVLSGLWHGANWTFVIWGALHGSYLVFAAVTRKARKRLKRTVRLDAFPRTDTVLKIVTVFVLTAIAWVFFRAKSVEDAVAVWVRLPCGWGALLHPPVLAASMRGIGLRSAWVGLAGVGLVESVQILQRYVDVQTLLSAQPLWIRWGLYYSGIGALILLYAEGGRQFIYFQF